MKKSKFFKKTAVAITILSYVVTSYLFIKQYYNHNFLVDYSYVLFILAVINSAHFLFYTCSRYYVSQFFSIDFAPNGVKVKAYCNCHGRTLKFVEAKGRNINKSSVLPNMTCSHAKVKFRRIFDESISEEDQVYKATAIYIFFSLIPIIIAGFTSFILLNFRVYNDLSHYYRSITFASRSFSTFTAPLAILMLLTIFYFYRALLIFKNNEELWGNGECRCSSLNIDTLPILTNDVTSRLLSTSESSPLFYDAPASIPLLPSPTPSSNVFSFLSAPSSPTLKVKIHSVLPSVEDIMPKLLDDPKPSSSGIGSSIRFSLISKSKLKQIPTLTENVSITSELSVSSQPSLLSFRRIKSWPNLCEKEPLESVFPTSANDIIHNRPFTTIQSLIPQLFSNGCPSSSPTQKSKPMLKLLPTRKALSQSSFKVFTSLSSPSSPVSTPPELDLFSVPVDDVTQKVPSTPRIWTPTSSLSTPSSSSPILTPRPTSPPNGNPELMLSSSFGSSPSLSQSSCLYSKSKFNKPLFNFKN